MNKYGRDTIKSYNNELRTTYLTLIIKLRIRLNVFVFLIRILSNTVLDNDKEFETMDLIISINFT